MKIVVMIWALGLAVAEAFSGTTSAPVIVSVIDSEGQPVVGAEVHIAGSHLQRIPEQELDPKSKFAELARRAARPMKTDAIGMALVYCAGGYIPAKGSGIMCGLSGTVVVEAEGFETAHQEFRRSFASSPEGSTELVLKINVTLKAKHGIKSEVQH